MSAKRFRVAVVGAGVFGGWSALLLARRGAEVVLVDAWGPGNSRSSSGGETRVLRCSYPGMPALKLAERSRGLWIEEQQRAGRRLFEPIGLLWLAPDRGDVERLVIENLGQAGIAHEWWDRAQVSRTYPQIRTDDLAGALFEPGAGYLLAREACGAVRDALLIEGGSYQHAWVQPGAIRGGEMTGLGLSDGTTIEADAYVFAVGPWLERSLGTLPNVSLPVTRQEVFTFGTPEGDDRFGPGRLPVWAYNGGAFWYGIPGDGALGGFKVADDSRGRPFDPTDGDRTPSAVGIARARQFLAERFPGMAGAPLIQSTVCQYTGAVEGRFLADRLPGSSNAWVVGGGSGHGFKHGPGVGEYVASLVLGDSEPGNHPAFSTIAENG